MAPKPGVDAYYWCIGLFAASLSYSVLVNHLYYRMFCGGLQQRAALLTALYQKVVCFLSFINMRFSFSWIDPMLMGKSKLRIRMS